jgi:outer membrane protein TolC
MLIGIGALGFLWSIDLDAEQGHGVLNRYIEAGLQNNLALRQETFCLQKSLQVLKEARGMFWPSVSIEARYSRAGGGRVIEFPVGDLVNPIHRKLNQLLSAPLFPGDLVNEVIPFLRQQEHETKLRVVQPLFQPAIYYNVRIKARLSQLQQARLDAYKRELVLDIKTAYFNYLKALKVREALHNTRELLRENLRISCSLFENHKVTEEVVFRSRAELSGLEQQIAEIEKNVTMAASYFNFLLNRPLDEEIKVDHPYRDPVEEQFTLAEYQSRALARREEFHQLAQAIGAAGNEGKLHGAGWLPQISAVFDYGFQGETYRFSGGDDFWMASLVLSWNLFRGGQDRARELQANLEKRRLEARLMELENQVRLGVREAYYGLQVAGSAVRSAEDRLHSSRAAFHIVSKKYEQGMVPQIEYMQARSDYTNAEIKYIVARYDFFIQAAKLERAAAAYPFNKEEIR